MSEAKKPKPFLKKGTRQYLSNATVRSLNQVPKIVDFGAAEDGEEVSAALTNAPKREPVDFKVEIKVNSKPPPKKEGDSKPTPKAKENKNMNQDKNAGAGSQTKKKSTGLDDYIVVKNNKKDNPVRQSNSKQKTTPRTSMHNEPKASMVGFLKRQDEVPSDEEDDDNVEIEEKQPTKPPKAVANPKPQPVSVGKKVINIDLEEHTEKINFNSDSDQETPKVKNAKPARPQIFPKPVQKKKWEDEQPEEKGSQQPKGPSKILQKYYKKQPQMPMNSQPQKKLTTADIPKQLKQQILNQLLAEKESDIRKKLDQLKNEIQRYKKERETLEESSKQLAKEREQFQKEMQRRKKQFQEKVNAENGKLAREKRYMKDHQTNGKVDWKVKNEVEDLRSKLDLAEAEKKRIKADLTRQVDRLKKKVEEQEHQTDILKGQIRCIQMEKLKERQQVQKVQKRAPQITRYWQDAPTSSYVSNFFQDNFTLISLDPSFYSYESLQYYQYYLTKKDQSGDLVVEEKDQSGSKIMRRYKSGKEQTQFVSKSLKESFPAPYKFTIVHHVNGDVKMILPEGIHVYYDNRNRITQWKVNPDKIIHNFHQHHQVEMKVKSRRGELKEQYKNGVLNRVDNGECSRFKRGEDGQVMRLG